MNFDKYFQCDEIKLKDQKVNKKLQVNIIMKITTDKYGQTYLLYNKKHNRKFFANAQLKAYLNKIDNLKNINNIYYKDDDLSTILEFKIKLITIDKDNNKKVEIDFMKKHQYESETLELSDSDNFNIQLKNLYHRNVI